MRRFRQRKAEDSGIDMSPLIDMVFILLIFFMVTTTFVKDMKLELERPGAASATRASTKAIRVYIDQAGEIYVEDAPVKPWMLQSRVGELVRAAGEAPVLVITDRLVPAERLIEVIDQCRLAGASEVGVATQHEAG